MSVCSISAALTGFKVLESFLNPRFPLFFSVSET